MLHVERLFDVRFDAESQLHLSDRKLLYARLSLIKIANAHTFLRARGESEAAQDLVGKVNEAIDRIWAQDVSSANSLHLDSFLRAVRDLVREAEIHNADDVVGELFREFSASIDYVECGRCGKDTKTVCNGSALDHMAFEDFGSRLGGLCLSFLRRIIKTFAHIAEDRALVYAVGLDPEPLPRRILLQTASRQNSKSSTLPLDGSFKNGEKVDEGRDAVLRVEWPIGESYEDIDLAILSLPYLVFHELFVHGPQGCAAAEPIGRVGNDCAFTEGAVDAVACEILKDEVLASTDHLPEELYSLRAEFQRSVSDYHNERFQFTPPKTERDLMDNANIIKQARWSGREYIFQYLRNTEINCGKSSGWCFQCIISLNFQMTKTQRRELARQAAFWLESMQADICVAMDEYLECLDPAALLDRLKRLKK